MIQKLKNYYHLVQAILANILYGFPSRKLIVIGVTGTDGKTTTSSIAYHILKESGKKAALISTVGAFIGDKKYDLPFHVTTPSSFGLQKYIKKAVDSGCKYLVLEITSHGLDQYRDWGIHYRIGIITNITHEHLDYHKTYENYVRTKVRLPEKSKICVINKDDESFEKISNLKSKNANLANKKWITYGINKNSDINPENFSFKTKLVGEFNVLNSLAAASACLELSIDKGDIQQALSSFVPPKGRQEVIYDRDFTVMIDFAHTPNSFLQILPALKKRTKGRLIHVFGAAGLRDHTKRPLMGEASGKYADFIVLTAEDPRSESVDSINQDIESGIKGAAEVEKIPNRKEAITRAIKLSKKGDMVLITGKGHEKSMNMGNGEEPWNEFEIVNQALKDQHLL